MARRVRIEGDPDEYEVLCETEATKVLVNRAAQRRRDVVAAEAALRRASSALDEVQRQANE